MKVPNATEDFQKHFLSGVRGIRRITQNAVHQAVDRLVKFADQPVVGILRACL